MSCTVVLTVIFLIAARYCFDCIFCLAVPLMFTILVVSAVSPFIQSTIMSPYNCSPTLDFDVVAINERNKVPSAGSLCSVTSISSLNIVSIWCLPVGSGPQALGIEGDKSSLRELACKSWVWRNRREVCRRRPERLYLQWPEHVRRKVDSLDIWPGWGVSMGANVSSFQPGSGRGEGICAVELHQATPSGGDAKEIRYGLSNSSGWVLLTRQTLNSQGTWEELITRGFLRFWKQWILCRFDILSLVSSGWDSHGIREESFLLTLGLSPDWWMQEVGDRQGVLSLSGQELYVVVWW